MRTPQQIIEELASKENTQGKSIEVIALLRQYVMLDEWLGQLDSQMEQAFFEAIDIATYKEPQVYIGDVLNSLEQLRQTEPFENTAMRWVNKILNPWSKCCLTKSLQEIAEESGYEEVAECECKAIYHLPPSPSYNECWESHRHTLVQRLKSPSARALFEFLDEVLPNVE